MNESESKSGDNSQVSQDIDPADGVAPSAWWQTEDWLAVGIGMLILLSSFICLVSTVEPGADHPWKPWVGKPGAWESNPIASLSTDEATLGKWKTLVGPFVIGLLGFGLARRCQGKSFTAFLVAFPVMFLLATIAYVMAGQVTVKHYNLEYALWALLVGLVISNTIGVPEWLRPAVLTELYIKTGLVILGAEVLWHRLVALGVPGIFVAWVVTPVVLITTYWFGTRVLKIPSKSLNMVISADMSVCGVSAAIATAASCRAKKEELSFAISISLAFTVVMMVVMPILIRALGISNVVGGAWMGGTIDSTGAVAAAGASLDSVAEQTAATVKMIQNILIGVTAFGVAVYWVMFVERDKDSVKPDAWEIWRRFPKFVLGFVAASLIFTLLSNVVEGGEELVATNVKQATKGIRGWFFCLAFVSIGLDSRFRELRKQFHGGKPLLLYVCGQSLNLVLTLLMAYLMFEIVFADYIQRMLAQ
ncbi:MAG: YeiH family protein [Rubripirellula sp.]